MTLTLNLKTATQVVKMSSYVTNNSPLQENSATADNNIRQINNDLMISYYYYNS